MGKGLAIVGITASVAASLAMLVLVSGAQFLVLPVIVAGSIVLVAQRSVGGAIAGLLVLALAVVAAIGMAGSLTTKSGGETNFGFSEDAGRVLAIAGCLSIPLAALIVRWHWVEPQSLSYIGIFCIAVAFLMAVLRQHSLADQSDLLTLASGLLPLGGIVPMVGLIRGAPEDGDDSAPAPQA